MSQPIASTAELAETPIVTERIRDPNRTPGLSERINEVFARSKDVDIAMLADAFKIMAGEMEDTTRVHSDERNQTSFQATTTTYFERTAALEESFVDMRRADALQLRTARDALCSAKQGKGAT